MEGTLFHCSLILFLHTILYCLCCDLLAHCLKFVCQHYILQETDKRKSFGLVHSKLLVICNDVRTGTKPGLSIKVQRISS